MKNFKLIGLTGTTGAGKSEVALIFQDNGYEVIFADLLAREIMSNDLVLQLLKDNFGEDIAPDNALDRKLLAARAFENEDTKKLLDSITHPFISSLFFGELKKLTGAGSRRIIFDASQLFESGLDLICDYVISVTAPEELRLSRVVERDGLTEEEAKRRINVQFRELFFRENSDYIIENNSDFNSLRTDTEKVIKTLEVRFGSDKKA